MSIFIIKFLSFFQLALANTPNHKCDNLAAHPEDPYAVTDGIDWDNFTNVNAAITECEIAVNEFPEEPRFLYQLGRSYLKKENYRKAFEYFTKASSKDYYMAYYILGVMSYDNDGNLPEYSYEFQLNNFQNANRIARKYIENYDLDSQYYIAETFYQYEKYEKAIIAYEDLINDDEEYFIYYKTMIVSSLYFLEKYEDVIIQTDKLLNDVSNDDKFMLLYYYVPALFSFENKISEAKKSFRELENYYLSFDEESKNDLLLDFSTLLETIGNFLESHKRTRDAIYFWEKGISYNPNFANFYIKLSTTYNSGLGVAQNNNKAFDYLKKGEKLNNPLILSNIGYAHEFGYGVEQSFEKAKEYYEKVVQLENNTFGFYDLGLLYLNGYGVEKNLEKVKELYTKGIKKYEAKDTIEKYVSSFDDEYYYQEFLKFIDEYSLEDNNLLTKNEELLGPLVSQNCAYLEQYVNAGYDQSNDFDMCYNLAENGDKDAQYYIGYFHKFGIVVRKNHELAAYWFKEAISNGEKSSLYEMSDMVVNGYVEVDDLNLIDMLNESVLNYPELEAIYRVLQSKVFKYGIGAEINYDQAENYLEKIINLNFDDLDDADTLQYNLLAVEEAIKELDQIKSLKAGFALENKIIADLPLKLEGNLIWEDDNYKVPWLDVVFDRAREISTDRFILYGSYNTDDETNVTLKALINNTNKSIEIWESDPVSEDPDFDPEFDFITDGSYVGFYEDKLSSINTFWIPNNTGSRAILNLNRTDLETKNTNLENTKDLNFGNYYAVVIGNNDYEYFEDLDTARIDATTVAEVLKNKYGFEILKVLIDANERDIISSLNSINKNLSAYDNLLIYYAGHGFLDETDRGYWLPVDANTPDSLDTSAWISVDDISNILTRLSPKHILVVADSCYSGSLVLQRGSAAVSEASFNHYKQLLEKKTRRALTSGALQPVLDGGGEGHSVFASAFLRVLSENNDVIDTSNLFNRINLEVSSKADQTPLYNVVPRTGDEGGDFIFVPAYSN